MPRTVRLIGVVVLLTGVWTALVPFAGPSFGFAPAGAVAWKWTVLHWQLGLAPGVAAAVAGVTLLVGGAVEVWIAKLVAYAAGLWLLAGPVVEDVRLHQTLTFAPQTRSQAAVVIGYLIAPGVVLVTAAALAAGRRVATIVGDADSGLSPEPLSVGEWR